MLIEIPRPQRLGIVRMLEVSRRTPRTFVELAPGHSRQIARALEALNKLPPELEGLPGFDDLSTALIAITDELDGDSDVEPNCEDRPITNDEPEDDRDEAALPLFAGLAGAASSGAASYCQNNRTEPGRGMRAGAGTTAANAYESY